MARNSRKYSRFAESLSSSLLLYTFGVTVVLICSGSRVWAEDDAADWSSQCSVCKCSWVSSRRNADCSNQSINTLPEGLSTEIESINLAYNHMYSLRNKEFLREDDAQLKFLKKINLQFNILTIIETGAFDGLPNLMTLDLSHNKIERIDPEVFKPLLNLQELALNNNPLVTFVSPALSPIPVFPPLRVLSRLELGDCFLDTLTPGIFDNVGSLTFLNLSSNRFRRLDPRAVEPLTKLKNLYLINNPWDCDCHNRELFQWASTKKLALKTACEVQNEDQQQPEVVLWDRMNVTNFFCKPTITVFRIYTGEDLHEGPVLSVPKGSEVKFECHVEADPHPKIVWLRNKLPVPADDKYAVSTNGNGSFKWSTLIVSSLTRDDAGEFTCQGFQLDGGITRNTEVRVEVAVAGGSVVFGAGIIPTSKTWLWILLGMLGFIVFVAFIIILVLCCLRQRRLRRKTYDQNEKVFIPHQDVVKRSPEDDRVDAPLLEKPAPVQVETVVPLLQSEPAESTYAEVRSMTPMPGFGYNPPGPLTRTYLSNSQVHLPREFYYHPGGSATYDPRRGLSNAVEINFKPPPTPVGRMYSPFSGSVASFASEPAARVPHGLGYVTLPRRRRVPSWSPAQGSGAYPRTHIPPSPTGSLPPVPNLKMRYQPRGPRFDSVGPRTTADGGSNLSLNQVGLERAQPTPSARTPAGYITPATPATPSSARLPPGRNVFSPITPSSGRIPKSNTSLQNYMGLPGTHFTFDPIQENDGPTTPVVNDVPWQFPSNQSHSQGYSSMSGEGSVQDPQQPKIPPVPPAKPKRKSQNLEDLNIVQDIAHIEGTEV